MADAHAKQHDYHLVDPSPWPIIGAISALAMTMGGVYWFRGGTPLVAKEAPAAPIARKITVRFDGNVAGGLPWTFAPERREIEVAIGETALVHYVANSLAARETAGIASYNVSPPEAASYFDKIQCFCFTDQKLSAGERVELPVVFFVDPAIDQDAEFKSLRTITLSYTFFPSKKAPDPQAAAGGGATLR